MENKLLEDMEYIGDIPEGWKWVKLGEIAEIKTGKTNSQDSDEMGNYPLFDRSRVIKRSKKFLFDTEAVIIPGEGKEFIPRYYNGKFDLHQRTYAIFNFKKSIPKFIYYNILLNKDILKYFATGSTVLSLRLEHFLNFPIILPPIEEQKAIVDVLSSIDDKIELLHRQNKTLEEMAMTLFRQWFIEPTKDGLPDGWEEVSLGDVFDYLEGPGIRNWQYSTKGIPFLNIRLIENGEINIKNANFISEEEAFGKYKKFLLQEGDVVISTSGTLGKYAIVRKYHLPLLLNTSIIRFRPKNKNYRIFMYLYLKSREFKEYLESSADGSVQANFGPTHLRTIKIIIPPNHTLEKFENAISPFYERINNNYSQIQTLEKLRDTLLPKLMSGEIRVKI